MNDSLFAILTFASALGCGLNAGVFFTFSSFVMKALARLPPPQGIAAMNSINILAVTPLFMTALFGTAAACLLLAVWTLARWPGPAGLFLLLGTLFYLAGTILVTIVFNVPRNDALAAVNPSSDEGARLWADYLRSWTAWNHVRTIAALVATALLMVGLLLFTTGDRLR